MNHFWAILYGILQGITEFLPVSSSGHLALLPYFGDIKDPGLFFDLAMHVGTALSVLIYFRKDVLKICKNLFNLFNPQTDEAYFTQFFCVATVITGVVALLLKSFAEQYGRHHYFIAFNLLMFGFLLYYSDKINKANQLDLFKMKKGIKASIIVGLFQVLAIFPGVSRSGITITAARFFGASKESASTFSFLLSLPLIIAGAIFKWLEIKESQIAFDIVFCIEGVVVSFVVGVLTIHFFLKMLKKVKFVHFFYYRALLAIGIIVFSLI